MIDTVTLEASAHSRNLGTAHALTGVELMTGAPPLPVPPDTAMRSLPETRRTAELDSRSMDSSITVVGVHGEVDAANAGALIAHALAHVTRCRGLVVDLRCVDFMGTDGFLALRTVADHCARAEVGVVVVTGAGVSRLLRICDPHGLLLVAATLGAALATLRSQLEPDPARIRAGARRSCR